jgi:hypothetical protein
MNRFHIRNEFIRKHKSHNDDMITSGQAKHMSLEFAVIAAE